MTKIKLRIRGLSYKYIGLANHSIVYSRFLLNCSPSDAMAFISIPDNCVMISPDGNDDPQCLKDVMNIACKTINYPINQGFSSICLHGTFYNMPGNIGILHKTSINIFCKRCILLDSEITLSCQVDKICSMLLSHVVVKDSTIRLHNIYVIFSNVTLDQTVIEKAPFYSEKGNNQIQFENSTLTCSEPNDCGLYFTNISATKIIFVWSNLNNFRLEVLTSQLIFICHETYISMSRININVRSFEYLKIPAIIEFDQVKVVGNKVGKAVPHKVKRNVESKSTEYFIIFDLTNPYVVIRESYFNGIHLHIQSNRQQYEPVLFSILFERCYFTNSHHVGDGGGLTIISEVKSSEVTVLDSVFSKNTAVKGIGNSKGRGGGLYINSESLKLIMTGSIFQDNTAKDQGLALYTMDGVDVFVTNCSFQHSVDPYTTIQQSILFVSGLVTEFQGVFQIFNARPELYDGSIEVFYMGQGTKLNIKTYCPKWYNHLTEYTSVSIDSQAVPDVKYKCIPCSDNYYTVAGERDTLSMNEQDNNTIFGKMNGNSGIDNCEKCPYGALCTGNNVMPRPNYWGYWHEGKLMFQQCPAEYCCSGIDINTCNVYDYCPANRTGILCGACKEGFSVSILTGSCIPDSQCGGDQWFWLVAMLATLAYALWYSLKDDIFSLAFGTIISITRMCKQSNSKINNDTVEMQPADSKSMSISSFQNSSLQEIDSICSGKGDDVDHIKTKVKGVKDKNDQKDVDLTFDGLRCGTPISKQSTSKTINDPVEIEQSNGKRFSIPSIQNSQPQGIDVLSTGIGDDVHHGYSEVIEVEKENSQKDADKGYFGIVTYYVQMAAIIKIQIEFSDIDKSEPFLDKIISNIGRFLNIELTQMSFDVCPITGLTTMGKQLYKLVFLIGIYVSWAGFFVIIIAAITVLNNRKMIKGFVTKLESLKMKLITGVIEIIKYTYAGFCGVIFMSLVCAQIGNEYVWWYDGTNICLENWQVGIVIFALFYAVPFPLTLALGMKLLRENKISTSKFVCCCLCPLVALVTMLVYIRISKDSKDQNDGVLSDSSEAVISVLQGPYRDDGKHVTLYWEAMVSVRRLLITGMTLVSYASIRMIIISVLSLIFLMQHNYTSPFEVRSSNGVEALSLALLLLTAVINLLKASLTDSGVVPSGPTVPFFKGLELCEKMFVLLIIAYILIMEVKLRKQKKEKAQIRKTHDNE